MVLISAGAMPGAPHPDGGRPLAAARLDARGRWLASFGVSMRLAPGRGQCVMAERAFAPGDVVLSSEPFASVLFPALRNERCHECFSRAAKLSRCSRCKVARYCSTVCQQRAWHAHHKFQCAIQGDIDHACETLPPVAQQELCLLIQVALKAIAPSPTQPAAESQGAAAAGSPCRGEGKGGWGNTGGFLADFDDVLGMPPLLGAGGVRVGADGVSKEEVELAAAPVARLAHPAEAAGCSHPCGRRNVHVP